MRSKLFICLAIATLFLALPAVGQLQDTAAGPIDIPDDFMPPGNLYDNDVSDGITSLASQDSDGTFNIRSADDFTINNAAQACDSGQYEITEVRVQTTQQNAAPQAFGFEFYDGDATSPLPTNAAVPIATLAEIGQTNLGPFGATTSLFEVAFDGAGTILDGDTIYWTSAFGTDAAANAGGFNNFYASSLGAAGTVANAQIFSPDFGIPDWVPVESVIGGPPLAYSFAIDGICLAPETPTIAIPTLNSWGLLLLIGLLAAVSMFFLARTRRV